MVVSKVCFILGYSNWNLFVLR